MYSLMARFERPYTAQLFTGSTTPAVSADRILRAGLGSVYDGIAVLSRPPCDCAVDYQCSIVYPYGPLQRNITLHCSAYETVAGFDVSVLMGDDQHGGISAVINTSGLVMKNLFMSGLIDVFEGAPDFDVRGYRCGFRSVVCCVGLGAGASRVRRDTVRAGTSYLLF